MFYQEKRTIVSILSTLIIFWFYWMVVLQKYQEQGANSPDEFSFWAAAILILVPVFIVSKVILYVVFVILNTIATQEEETSITDERNRLIELKATQNAYHAFYLGFFLAMATQVIKLPPAAMFIILTFSLILALLVWDMSQLYFHRRGV